MKRLGGIVLFLVLVLSTAVTAKSIITFSGVYAAGEAAVDVQNKFKELLEERSGGKYEVRVIIGSAMGGERDHIEAASAGALELIAMGPGDMALYAPEYTLSDIPFLIRDRDHFFALWLGEVGQTINKLSLEMLGVRTLGVMYRGPRYLTSNRPIKSVEDLRGLRLRLPEVEPIIRVWQALGTAPVPVAFHEVYSALQTGIAEAQENPIMSIYGYKFHEVQKYLIATRHIYSIAKFQVSEQWFKKLSAADQQLIADCMAEAVEYGNQLVFQREAELMDELLASGMTIIEPPELDLDGIRSEALKIIEKMVQEGMYNKELYDKVQQL
ncbi:MAG: TRAP transporter substrate-binding protein [Firmicutes bacterium]|nr:TRAP transporter substrate-binding protein [Bacillota bacterium]